MVDLEEKKDPPQKCAFCYLDKNEVTMVNDETGKEEKISKKDAAEKYKLLLKKLKESKNIQDILSKQSVPIIKNE
jgi:F0F1-type ATP synthase epsilon subunit